MLTPQESSMDEMLRSLSDHQKELLLFGMQDAYAYSSALKGGKADKLNDALAADETMLANLEELYR